MSTESIRSVLLAPGQGSQRENMYALAEKVPEVRETYELADELVIELFGTAGIEGKVISEHAKQATKDELASSTTIAQPLIVATSVGLIKHLKKNKNFTTAYGHSLGELSALYAAGAIGEEDVLRLAMFRGLFSGIAIQQRPAAMAALLNLPQEIKDRFDVDGEENGEPKLSTENSPDEFTISGPREKIDAVVEDIRNKYQKARGLSKEEYRQLPGAVRLKIEGGFHSWLMRPAQADWREALNKADVSVPTDMNFFSNHSHTYEASPEVIKDHLVGQLVHPVRFWMDIGKLIADGHLRIVESGAGAVMSKGLKDQQNKGRLPSNVEILAGEEDIIGIAT